jgi:signal transduction histidine kinase
MHLKLRKQVGLSMLLPVLIASSIIIYAVYNLGTIANRIKFIEIADDMNMILLELRRYEKNILLFHEDENIRIFHGYLKQIDEKVIEAENEIIEKANRLNYKQLQENIAAYKNTANSLIAGIKAEQEVLQDIRPLGRRIEKSALRKEKALELRRYEKNYIIYREQAALDSVNRIAKELQEMQPELGGSLMAYMKVFDMFLMNESLKKNLVEKMRTSGRAIEAMTREFSQRKRLAIDKSISTSRNLLFVSFIFLIISTSVVAVLFSSRAIRLIRIIENTFGSLKAGNFNRGVDLDSGNAPEEIKSFAEAYNQTIKKLGESREELETTLKKLEDTNRELLEKQDELVEARKLSAMRLLASEISHEINNPLSALTTFMGICHEETPDDDPKKETIALMLQEVVRCQTVLRELVDFARKEPLKLREVDPSNIIRDAIKVVTRQHEKSGINLIAFVGELPEKVLVDPVLIRQALVNILSNAYQFTKPGGRVEVEGYTDCSNVVIEIRDTGTGITEENIPNIFEPFFSTRKELGGSGLGLALTKKIIERHHGKIKVESKVAEETVFTISMPIDGTRECQR